MHNFPFREVGGTVAVAEVVGRGENGEKSVELYYCSHYRYQFACRLRVSKNHQNGMIGQGDGGAK